MKKIKILAVVVSVALLFAYLMPCVLAANITDGLNFLEELAGISDEDVSKIITPEENTTANSSRLSDFFTNPSGIASTVRGFLSGAAASASDSEILGALQALLGSTDFSLSSILSSLTGGGLLSQLQAYLSGADATTVPDEPTTAPTTTEPTTVPPTTEAPVTQAPVTQAPATTRYNNNNSSSSSSSGSSNNSGSYATPSTTKAPETTTYAYVSPEIVTAAPVTEDNFTPVVTDVTDDEGGVSVKMIIGIVILAISGAAVVCVAVVLKKTRV